MKLAPPPIKKAIAKKSYISSKAARRVVHPSLIIEHEQRVTIATRRHPGVQVLETFYIKGQTSPIVYYVINGENGVWMKDKKSNKFFQLGNGSEQRIHVDGITHSVFALAFGTDHYSVAKLLSARDAERLLVGTLKRCRKRPLPDEDDENRRRRRRLQQLQKKAQRKQPNNDNDENNNENNEEDSEHERDQEEQDDPDFNTDDNNDLQLPESLLEERKRIFDFLDTLSSNGKEIISDWAQNIKK